MLSFLLEFEQNFLVTNIQHGTVEKSTELKSDKPVPKSQLQHIPTLRAGTSYIAYVNLKLFYQSNETGSSCHTW